MLCQRRACNVERCVAVLTKELRTRGLCYAPGRRHPKGKRAGILVNDIYHNRPNPVRRACEDALRMFRAQLRHLQVAFANEVAATLSRPRKVALQGGRGTRTTLRFLLRPDGLFRWPDGTLYLIEVERARRYDYRRVLAKFRRHNQIKQNEENLWKSQWQVEALPPVLVLGLNVERQMTRLQGDDPLSRWRFWHDGSLRRIPDDEGLGV